MQNVYRSGGLPEPFDSLPQLPAGGQADVVLTAAPALNSGGISICVWAGDEDPADCDLPGLLAQDVILVFSDDHAQTLEQAGVPGFRVHTIGGADPVGVLAEVVERLRSLSGPEIVWRGPFGRHSSLALVNSELAGQVQRITGRKVICVEQTDAMHPSRGAGVSHSWPPNFVPASQGPQIAILPWEFGDPPVEWMQAARARLDQVWVPSQYIRDGYVNGGMPPQTVRVVPNGIDHNLFHPDGNRLLIDERQAGRCVFLFVGGSIMRKGIDLLQRAWERAFSADDEVLLIIKDFGSDSFYRGQNANAQLREWATRDDHAPVVFTDRHLAPEEMPQLYRAADVMLLPYRGEGFCLPALEAMACATPIIHPDQGPTREFCEEGGWAVPARKISLNGSMQIPLTGPGYLHEIELDQLVETMRAVAADPRERQRRAQAAAKEAERMTWQRMGEIAARLIAEAEQRQPVRFTAPASLPDRRAVLIAATADWGSDRFAGPLAQAVAAIPPDAPVTLACSCQAGRADQVTDAIIAALQAASINPDGPLCDLTVVEEADANWQGLVLAADAVLVLDEPRGDLSHARAQLKASEVAGWVSARVGRE